MRTTYVPSRWLVFRYDLEWPPPSAENDRLLVPATLADLADRGRRQDQPFLIGPDGRPDPRVNAFFASGRMLARSPLTWTKYAQSIALWLNFLLASGQRWDVSTATPGISAVQLQRQLGLGRYETAWMMLHKLRRAMVNPERTTLTGPVEVDECFIGGPSDLRGGRRHGAHALVIVAAEVRGNGTGRIRLQVIDNASADSSAGWFRD